MAIGQIFSKVNDWSRQMITDARVAIKQIFSKNYFMFWFLFLLCLVSIHKDVQGIYIFSKKQRLVLM